MSSDTIQYNVITYKLTMSSDTIQYNFKSPLPLTDPCDAVPQAHRVVQRCPTKLTAPERISHSRDMVGAHQNLNGSRDLTTPLSGMVCHRWASTCYRQPTYQIWSLYLHTLWGHARRYTMSKWGGLG